MITDEIEFHSPTHVDDALRLLASRRDDLKILGGGMSLLPAMNLGLVRPRALVSLNHIASLSQITTTKGGVSIGGTARHADIRTNQLIAQHCPLVADAAGQIGDVQVRHRGTIGGSCAHADPAADYLPVLVALDATIVTRRADRERRHAATEFFTDIMTTALEPDELITEIIVPDTIGATTAYCRMSKVEGSFAIASAAVVIAGDGHVRVVIGGATNRPLLVANQIATGDDPGVVFAQIAADIRAATPRMLQDLNADRTYRGQLAVVYAQRAFDVALAQRDTTSGM